jgi:peptide/nickel transport system ATP-binding protein
MLDIAGLNVRFNSGAGVVHAVRDVSFQVPDGATVGIVGETGSGKSATVRSLIGLLPPAGRIESGSIALDGQQLVGRSRREMRRLRGSRIGFVGQSPFGALNPVLTIEKQFRNVIRAHRKASKKEARELALEQLRSVGIAGPERVLAGYAHELSGGMTQRVVIAMALALGADLLIADEPTTALDATVQRQILDLLKGLVADRGRSMVMVSHDLGVIAQYCDIVLVMYAGEIVESGPMEQVFTDPAHPYTLGLLRSVPDESKRFAGIPGSVPNLVDEIHGCPFRPRCPFAIEACATVAPRLEGIDATRKVSCHLNGKLPEVKPDAAAHR